MRRKSFLVSVLLLPVYRAYGKLMLVLPDPSCKTQRDQEGPYYKPGAPTRSKIESEGDPLTIGGSILRSSDCATPIANAIIDIWHCDNGGEYDNEGFKCRGIVRTDKTGKYSFTTIFPPPYGSRPRHIHIKVRAEGFQELTSQIYFKGDKNLQNDFARNANAARVIALTTSGKALRGKFDIYL